MTDPKAMPETMPETTPETTAARKPHTDSARMLGEIYQGAIARFVASLNDDFNTAAEILLATKGHVIVCGMGKSGLFARKISSTFASTGTPSIFLHPGEAIHGDLGKLRHEDTVIMISNSGETEEVLRLLPALARLGVTMIGMTGDKQSTLARHCKTVLDISVDREACPLNLAPTTSGLMTLVMGDALAIALMERRGFSAEDFAATHPGGALGRSLLAKVADEMVKDNLPFVAADSTMADVIVTMTQGRLGLALVGDAENFKGLITDGDLRRALVDGIDIATAKAADVMTEGGLTITPDAPMREAEARMIEARVQCLVVVEQTGRVAGVVQIY